MICPKCNAQIPDDARECPKCHFEQSFNEPIDFSARSERTIEHKEKSGTSVNTKNLVFIMVAILLLALTFLVYYIFAANSAETADAAAKVLPCFKTLIRL